MARKQFVAASDFKARCLRLLDEVQEHGTELVITKHGKPVAKLGPVQPGGRSLCGAWRGLGAIRGDIVHTDWTDDFEAAR